MSYILVVTIFTVHGQWIIGQARDELPMKDRVQCEAVKKAMDEKLQAKKGTQFITICRPDRTAA